MRVGYVVTDWRTPDLAHAAEGSIRRVRLSAPVAVVDAWRDRLSYSQACNRGLARLELLPRPPEVVCFCNADVEMLASDAAVLELFDADPLLAIVGPRQITVGPDGHLVAHGGIVPTMDGGTEWDLDLRHRYWLAPFIREDVQDGTAGTFQVPTVPGSVFYVHRGALKMLGGWPEWTRFYYEDTFLCYLARHYGLRVLYTGACTWLHHGERAPVSSRWRQWKMREAREEFIRQCHRHQLPLVVPATEAA